MSDGLIDGREGAPQEYRRREHQTGRQLSSDRKPSPEPEHHRLQEQAQRLRRDAKEPVSVRGRQRPVEHRVPQRGRARHNRVLHRKTLNGLAARSHLLDKVAGAGSRFCGLPLKIRRPGLVEQGDEQEQAAREHGQQPQHPVKHEQPEQEHWRPRRVEEREGARTRREALNRFQIAKARGGTRPFGRGDRAGQNGSEHARVEAHLHPCPGASEHPPARIIQHAHHQEEERHDDSERDQRRLRA